MDIRSLRIMKAPLLALAAAAACVLTTARTADADVVFDFNQGGTGAVGAVPISGFVNAGGNALAVGGARAIAGGVGSTFQLYVQTTISSLQGPPPNFAPLPLGVQLTAVASITEVVTGINGNIATFQTAAVQNPVSLALYQFTAPIASPYLGTGFITGAPILTATAVVSPGSGDQFQNFGGSVTFDQASGAAGRPNPTILSVNGTGSATVEFVVNPASVNAGFFPGGAPSVVGLSLNSAGLNATFHSVAPSISFTGPTGVTVTPNLGAINGVNGPDVQFQITGVLTASAAVPEPSSLCLMGLGLAGVVAVAHRKRRQVA